MTRMMTQTTSEPTAFEAAPSVCPTGVDVAPAPEPSAPRAGPVGDAAGTAPPAARGEPPPPPGRAGGTKRVLEVLAIPRVSCAAHARAGIDDALVRQYAEVLLDGGALPPVQACWDGDCKVHAFDGVHTLKAAESIGLQAVAVLLVAGELQDAMLRAAGANATHGKPRSKEDRTRAVERVLEVLGPDVSNRTVADVVQLSDKTVDVIRKGLGRLSRFKQKNRDEAKVAGRTRVGPEQAMGQALAALAASRGQVAPVERVHTSLSPAAAVANPDAAARPETEVTARVAAVEPGWAPSSDGVTAARHIVQGVVAVLTKLAGDDTLGQLAKAGDVQLLEELRGALAAVQGAFPRRATA